MLRLDALAAPLRAGAVAIVPRIPAWMKLPEPAGDAPTIAEAADAL
jgi:hypothetical protein